jgi:hypothetical protein
MALTSLFGPSVSYKEKSFVNSALDHNFLKDLLIGEMTGGDRALISSLEGLEDLQLIGELQLQDHRIKKGDLVFAVTEGIPASSRNRTGLNILY